MAAFQFPSGGAFGRFGGGSGSFGRLSTQLSGGGSTIPPPAISPDAAFLQGIVGDIGSSKALAEQNAANALAAQTQSAGYLREAEAYGTVGAIAEQNATIEGATGNIKRLQANRAVRQTVGRQSSEIAAAGFANAGSSLNIMKSTVQEGYLTDQLIQSQTSINQSGYLQQSAAAKASAEGARLSSDAALALSQGYTKAGELATATAASETAALKTYLETTGGIEDNAVADKPQKIWYDQYMGLHIDWAQPGHGNTNAARALAAQTLGLTINPEPMGIGGI